MRLFRRLFSIRTVLLVLWLAFLWFGFTYFKTAVPDPPKQLGATHSVIKVKETKPWPQLPSLGSR